MLTMLPPSLQGKPWLLSAAAALATLVLCLLQNREISADRAAHASALERVQQMAQDGRRISLLGQAPRRASDRERPNDELLSQVQEAMNRVRMRPDQWERSQPSPPRRLGNSPYRQVVTLLSLRRVSLQQVGALCHSLISEDPSLNVSQLRLSAAPRQQSSSWNAELTLTYLIYSPGGGG